MQLEVGHYFYSRPGMKHSGRRAAQVEKPLAA